VRTTEENNVDKSRRVLSIYAKLLDGKALRKTELAEYFGVNEKSIQRDLDTVRDFLDAEKMEQGTGKQLVYDYQKKGYLLEQDEATELSNDEMIAICKILLESRAFTKKEMMDILDRLITGCVPKENRRLVNDLLANERFHYVEPRHRRVFLDKLSPLGSAIKECRVIRLKYSRIKGESVVERRLEPLAILFSEYYFYVVGFIEGIDREKEFENPDDPFPTIYRIDRIQELEVLDEHFKIPYTDRFEEGEFRKRIQFMYGGKLRKVRFRYTGESVEAVLDRLPTARILGEEDGGYLIEAEVFGKGIDMWVRSQGEAIQEYRGC
jgi:predicted DNA-binding transcriptional regulator YafY